VLEIASDEPPDVPAGFETLDDRAYGGTRVLVLRRA
jgi:hypothetical protein